MTSNAHVEIESKFEVGDETPAPAPDAFAPLVADEPVVHRLSATYLDTADLSLTRHKVTLRRRTGGDDDGWHLKLPAEAGRLELHAPLGDDDEVPAELVAAVAGLVRNRPLTPVARIDNERRVLLLRDDAGVPVVEFCDDRVTTESLTGVTTGGGGDWREWEAEIVDPDLPGSEEHLAAVSAACAAAGGTPSSSESKLARALGTLPAAFPPGVSAVKDALAADLTQLLDHDPGARRGAMRGIHQMRVAVRGLRSTIGTYATELTAETEDTDLDLPALLGELKVLAAVLGKVRDLQVVDERLERLAEEFTDDLVSPVTRERIRTELGAEERRAQTRVAAALASDRYLGLVDRLHELVEVAGSDPAAGGGEKEEKATSKEGAGASPKKRKRAAQDMVLRGVDRQFAKFTKVRTRTERDLDSLDLTLAQREELTHVVRKRAKALRRNVNALPESGDLSVAPLRTACQRLHTVLGDVQDSVTARFWLRRIARRAEAAGESTFGLGVLFEHERGFSERALAGFEHDAATVTAAYRELAESRRAARRRKGKKGGKGKKKR